MRSFEVLGELCVKGNHANMEDTAKSQTGRVSTMILTQKTLKQLGSVCKLSDVTRVEVTSTNAAVLAEAIGDSEQIQKLGGDLPDCTLTALLQEVVDLKPRLHAAVEEAWQDVQKGCIFKTFSDMYEEHSIVLNLPLTHARKLEFLRTQRTAR